MNTATLQAESIPPVERTRPVSEDLANALRDDQVDEFFTASPYAACLLPLLRELGWYNYARELIEALPHFADQFDLTDLRNILVTLGYESTPLKTRVGDIKDELLPCLFIGQQGEIRILLSRQGEAMRYFDGRSQETLEQDIDTCKGTAYLFTDTQPTHGVSKLEASQQDWFAQLLRRFRHMLTHLLVMTFFINMAALSVPLFIMMIYDKVIGTKSPDTLPYLVSALAIVLLSDLVLRMLRARLLGTVAGRLDYLIGVETFRQMIQLPPTLTERSTVAAQLSRLKQFDSVRNFFTGPNAAVVLELPFVLLSIGMIAILAGPIALVPFVMVIAFLALGALSIPGLNRKILRSGRARTDKQRILMQTLAGRKEIKGIGGESVWWERFREVSGEAVIANYQTLVGNGVMNSLAQAMTTIAAVAVIGFGTLEVIDGQITVGALVAIMALVWRTLSPLQSAFLGFSRIQQTLKSMKQINQLMRLKVERQNRHSGAMIREFRGRIKVDRVSFRFGPDQDPALLGISFEVRPGEMLAITGNTGSGKSTILKLIAGMYQPQAGSLAIDDLDIRQLDAIELRRAIAYVPQETRFFFGSIAQNMRLNNGLATDEQLTAAAEEAGVLQDILRLPKGFDTLIGDSSTDHLPPGFLRALSMARAFVSPASILLLDEPGASLDEASDRRFVEQIHRLKGKRTIIMVSHRPSHIRLADKALLFDQGSMQFAGPPDQVITRMLESTP